MRIFTDLKKRAALAALCVVMLCMIAGCEKAGAQEGEGKESSQAQVSAEATPEASQVATPEPTPEATPDPTPEPTPSPEEIYAQMVELSLMYEGNYERIQKLIGKLRAGEEIRLAILGGSVTEGAGAGSNDKGYAYQFLDALAEEYAANGKDQILYVNAGLSGTPSVLGWMRYQQDVVTPLGGDPDLLIIEFAVNDWQEATNGRAYESMVYEALSAKEDAAVICLCSVAKTAWNTQDSYLTIAKHYQIPLVSLKKALFTPKNETRVAATKYFMDDYHPKFYGHELMKDCLMNLFAKADAAESAAPAQIPENAVKGRDFTGIVQVDAANKVKGMKTGSFGDVDDKVVTMYFTKSASFPNNFYHKAGTKNDPLKMTVKCKKILVNYKTSTDKSFGTAQFIVDGKAVGTAEGYSAGGWNNCNVIMVLDEKEAANHTFEVKMAEGSEDKAFTILSISYCE
jgi:hypothetical protein